MEQELKTYSLMRIIRLLDQQLINNTLYQGSNLWREVQDVLIEEQNQRIREYGRVIQLEAEGRIVPNQQQMKAPPKPDPNRKGECI